VGAVQRLATVVIVGLVALSTLLVLYLADESNRIDAREEQLHEDAIERATTNYMSLCLACHGPAGEGSMAGDGRIGMPLGGVNTSLNQQGIKADGTPFPGGVAARTTAINKVLHEGRGAMPAWGEAYGGPLNDEQIKELTYFIQHVDWNEIYNHAVELSDGYPTTIPTATATPGSGEPTAVPEPGTFNVEMKDIAFAETTLTVPANTEITINLTNTGAAPHAFKIEALGVDSGEYASGQSGAVTFNSGEPGTYTYICPVPGHADIGMVGTIVVE
jgi:plastocyanin/mono/diheme cytochrome c family protein